MLIKVLNIKDSSLCTLFESQGLLKLDDGIFSMINIFTANVFSFKLNRSSGEKH